jgi:hypothetical protein
MTRARMILDHLLVGCCVGLIISVLTHGLGMPEIDQMGASVAGAMIAIALRISWSIVHEQ